METTKTLYHGSTGIIKKPEFGKGSTYNDYGLGFYCTENMELAQEWACSDRNGGFANVYAIDTSGLSILDLSASAYSILHWMAVLVNNRVFDITSPISEDGKAYLTEFFLPDLTAFDAITGHHADDAYFSFARDFLSNTITVRHLSRAMQFGNLGQQFVLKSKAAFECIQFLESIPADGEVYFSLRQKRNSEASTQYLKRERGTRRVPEDLYLADVIREELKPGDERLQKILLA
jgi:hypothetical protein